MKRRLFWCPTVLAAFALLWAGCAMRTQIPTEDLTTLKGNTRFDTVLFRRYSVAPNVEVPPGSLDMARDRAMFLLRWKGVFKEVAEYKEGGAREKSALVEANVLELHLVDNVSRICFGPLSGRSYMKMNVKLTDGETGATIAQQDLEGSPNMIAASVSYGVADERLPISMGGLIADFVLAHSRKQP